MPRRAASVTQADISRAVRALKAEGFTKVRVFFVDGGVAVEPVREADGRDEFGYDPHARREPVELL